MEEKTRRQERVNSLLRRIISSFIKSNFDSRVIMTVTRVEIVKDLRSAKIFISVFPAEKEKEILALLKKKKQGLYNYVKSKSKMKFLPSFSFLLAKYGPVAK